MNATAFEVLALTIFPIWAGSELVRWPCTAELSRDTEIWALTISTHLREAFNMPWVDSINLQVQPGAP